METDIRKVSQTAALTNKVIPLLVGNRLAQ